MSQKGTKSYMAPEMIRMEKYGKNVDLYALGLTMYELLNHGRMPFLPPYPLPFYPQEREEAMIKRLTGQEFPEIEGIGELNDIIKKACHPQKEQRYQSATEMKKALLTLDSSKKLVDVNEDKTTMGVTGLFDQNIMQTIIETDDQTIGVFANNAIFQEPKKEFIFEDTAVYTKEPTLITRNDKTYHLVFTHGYYDLNNEVMTTSDDERTSQLKHLFNRYLGTRDLQLLLEMAQLDTNPQLYKLLADEYFKSNQKLEAKQWYEKAYQLDQEESSILKRMAYMVYQYGEFEKAITLCEKGIANHFEENKYVVHQLYFIQALSYQALNKEDKAILSIHDLYRFNFKRYIASMRRAEELHTKIAQFNEEKFMEDLLVNDRALSFKDDIFIAAMKCEIGGNLFKSNLTNHISKIKESYLQNPKKINKYISQAGVDWDEVYFYTSSIMFSDNTLFGNYGIYKYVEKKLFYIDYYCLPSLLLRAHDTPNLYIRNINDLIGGWNTVLSGAGRNPYLLLSLCEMKSAIVKQVTLPLDLELGKLYYMFNLSYLNRFGIYTIKDLVELSDQSLELIYKDTESKEYLHLKAVTLEL